VEYVGTGSDQGKVRVRFYKTGMNSGDVFYTNQLYVSYGVLMDQQDIRDSMTFAPTSSVQADSLDEKVESIASDVLASNVDSTGGTLPLSKAIEVITSFAIGKAVWDPDTKQWTLYGRDGTTPVATVVVPSEGNRESSEIL